MQPVTGWEYKRYTQGAGTDVVSSIPTRLHSLATFGTVAGTTSFYDTATAAGTTAANRIFTFNQVTGVGTVPQVSVFDYSLRYGLVSVTAGTVDFIVSKG